MFCITATTVAAIQNSWSGRSPDTPNRANFLTEEKVYRHE